MMQAPEIYILGRWLNGVYVEYLGDGSIRNIYDAIDVVNHLQKWEKQEGTWRVLKYGRPQTVERGAVDD